MRGNMQYNETTIPSISNSGNYNIQTYSTWRIWMLLVTREMVREAVSLYNVGRAYHMLKYRIPDVEHRGF